MTDETELLREIEVERMLPTAAAVVCGVNDGDRDTIGRILDRLDRQQLYTLTVILAAHVNPEQPFVAGARTPGHAMRVIAVAAARRFGIGVDRITARDQTRPANDARAVVCYAGHLLGLSSPEVGRYVGRDHSTVLYAIGRVGEDRKLRRIATELAAPYAPARDDDEVA